MRLIGLSVVEKASCISFRQIAVLDAVEIVLEILICALLVHDVALGERVPISQSRTRPLRFIVEIFSNFVI